MRASCFDEVFITVWHSCTFDQGSSISAIGTSAFGITKSLQFPIALFWVELFVMIKLMNVRDEPSIIVRGGRVFQNSLKFIDQSHSFSICAPSWANQPVWNFFSEVGVLPFSFFRQLHFLFFSRFCPTPPPTMINGSSLRPQAFGRKISENLRQAADLILWVPWDSDQLCFYILILLMGF